MRRGHPELRIVVLVANFGSLKNPQWKIYAKQNFTNLFLCVNFLTSMKKMVDVFHTHQNTFLISSTVVFKVLKITSFPFWKTHNKRYFANNETFQHSFEFGLPRTVVLFLASSFKALQWTKIFIFGFASDSSWTPRVYAFALRLVLSLC